MPVTTIRLPQTPDIGGTPSPQPTHLSVPGSAKPFLHPELGRVDAAIIGGPHIIKESPFYVAKPFAGKEAQMEEGEFVLDLCCL